PSFSRHLCMCFGKISRSGYEWSIISASVVLSELRLCLKVVALESANEQCSASVVDDTQALLFQLDARAKAQRQTILPMIEQRLQDLGLAIADLTAVAFSRGPGSFSGVRINAAVTQALAWSNDLPVIPVSTLQALAQAAYRLHGLTE